MAKKKIIKKNSIAEDTAPVVEPTVTEEIKPVKAKKEKKPPAVEVAKNSIAEDTAPIVEPTVTEEVKPMKAKKEKMPPAVETAAPADPMAHQMEAAGTPPMPKMKKARKPAKAAVVVAAPEALAEVVEPVVAPAEVPVVTTHAADPMAAQMEAERLPSKPEAPISEPAFEPMPVAEEPKKVVVAKKRKPAVKKMVVKSEPVYTKVAEPEPQSFVTPPQPEREPEPAPVAPKPPMQPRAMRPVMPPAVQRTTTEVETTTKTAVAIGLVAAGALALAAAAAILSLHSDNTYSMMNASSYVEQASAQYMPGPATQFQISIDSSAAAPSTDIVADGSEHAIAAFNVSTSGSAWTFEKLRVQLVGAEAVKTLTIRDEQGNPVLGAATPLAGSDHLYDLEFSQKILADTTKVYTVFATFASKDSAPVQVSLTVLSDGLVAQAETGEVASVIEAPIVGPSWNIVAPPAPAKKSSKKK